LKSKRIIIGVLLVAVAIGIIALFSPTIISDLQSSSSQSSSASYTSLMIRMGNYSATVDFGDTEYYFNYVSGSIGIYAPFQSVQAILNPEVGHTYSIFGVEIKVDNISSDYLSNYIVIGVKPTIANYMFSTYHYYKVNLTSYPLIQYGPPINYSITKNISSGITNETRQYTFTYYEGFLVVANSSLTREYEIPTTSDYIMGAETDFDIQIRVYEVEPEYLVIYVMPLY
jgi:hypothetical protein